MSACGPIGLRFCKSEVLSMSIFLSALASVGDLFDAGCREVAEISSILWGLEEKKEQASELAGFFLLCHIVLPCMLSQTSY